VTEPTGGTAFHGKAVAGGSPRPPDRTSRRGLPTLTPATTPQWRREFLERLLAVISSLAAIVPFLALAGMLVILGIYAVPSIKYNGFWHFITSSPWGIGDLYGKVEVTHGVKHLPGAEFGAYPLIIGTLETSAIALLIALPVAVGSAVLVVEKLPPRIAGAIGMCLEILAGIPSVVIGVWGALTFGPWIAKHIYPTLAHLPNVPPLDIFRGSVGTGEGLLTSGLVLAAMIVPIIAATTRDLLRQVPEQTKEGAEALGLTEVEVFTRVQARWIRSGVVGAAVLGLGRALGETIAVAFICGGQDGIAHNVYGAMDTIAAFIVTNLDAAQGDPSGLAVRAIAELALVLMIITLFANVVARFIVSKSSRGAALPVGAGF
jgi:phosphate transport system permease protein